MVSQLSSLENLAKTHPEIEVWWDSSPLIFDKWAEQWLAKQGESRPMREEQLARFFAGPVAERVICGVTTNPPLCKQVLDGAQDEWRQVVLSLVAKDPGASTYGIFWETYREVVRRGAELMMPIFEASNYKRGYLSGQVDPRQLHDPDAMVAQGQSLKALSPNVMIKMPGTKEGVEGIRRLSALGISTNATLTFAVSQVVAVAEAVRAGIEEAKRNNVDLSQWRSVSTLMMGRFEDAKEFRRQAEELGITLSETDLRWAGVAVFKKAQRVFTERGYATTPLAASMRLGPTVDGKRRIWHVEKLSGSPCVLTIFPNIIEAFLEDYDGVSLEGTGDDDIPQDVLDKLLRVPYFAQAYEVDGLTPDEFATYPATVETATQFAQATDEMIAWVKGVVEAGK